MVFTFRFVSDEVDDFMREVRIDADASFLDLRNIICSAAGYATDGDAQMQSFFTCDDGWEKRGEITLFDMGTSPEQDVRLMAETPICDIIEDEGDRLIFTFDYLADRSFFIELKATEPGVRLAEAEVTRSRGEAPAQSVDIDIFNDAIGVGNVKDSGAHGFADDDDDDDSFYGSDGYNDDELEGLGGFDGGNDGDPYSGF